MSVKTKAEIAAEIVTAIDDGIGVNGIDGGGVNPLLTNINDTMFANFGGHVYNTFAAVAKNGNDGTGVVGDLKLPFLTIGAAITAVDAAVTQTTNLRGLVIVFPGEYDESVTLVDNIDIDLGVATINYTTSDANSSILTGATNCVIYGNGTIKRTGGLAGSAAINATDGTLLVLAKLITASVTPAILNGTDLTVFVSDKIEYTGTGAGSCWTCTQAGEKITVFGDLESTQDQAVMKMGALTGLIKIRGNVTNSGTGEAINGANGLFDIKGNIFASGNALNLGGVAQNGSRFEGRIENTSASFSAIDTTGAPTNTFILNNVIIVTAHANFSINRGTSLTIKVYGDCIANKALETVITEQVDTFTIDSNVV
jgi:hypothetical protein